VHDQLSGRGQRHPKRDVRARAVALHDHQMALLTDPAFAENVDDRSDPRVVPVMNLRLARRLFMGTMSLLRPAPARATSVAGSDTR
jgi:hypothetical protein